ncbi:E3 ubiquitin-protein ligase [Sesamum alatum]|uniref:RING-type E3 ubiquitin transferase n=1 Tax=Sesamum alatum TaxID=300844 RepID=A0AAE1YVW2_9LAMI|nr:E3 ubiquitin-protein ligase [Sesamum alatum]
MAPPSWLPPLNSHQHSMVDVHIHDSYVRPSFGDHRLLMALNVCVEFYSENDEHMELPFPGFFLTYTTTINMKNPQVVEEELWDLILDEDLIPFPLDNCFVSVTERRQLHGSPPLPQRCNGDELVGRIFDFVHLVHNKPKNDGSMAVVSLEIQKNVMVPAEEFASWFSWYDEQKRIDPEFESEYSEAIAGPRDRSEVYQEVESLMARRPAKIVGGELETVVVNGGKDGASSCSICLEGFSDGGRGTRLPCNHMFHENCIVRWLRGNHVCPLCRYQLPVDDE